SGRFLPRADHGVAVCMLSAAERAIKRAMLNEYRSQRAVIAQFDGRIERYRDAPTYDFLRPPHAGPLYYEQLGWPLSGEEWRAAARLAAQALARQTGHAGAVCR